jgi:hypothetical protein
VKSLRGRSRSFRRREDREARRAASGRSRGKRERVAACRYRASALCEAHRPATYSAPEGVCLSGAQRSTSCRERRCRAKRHERRSKRARARLSPARPARRGAASRSRAGRHAHPGTARRLPTRSPSARKPRSRARRSLCGCRRKACAYYLLYRLSVQKGSCRERRREPQGSPGSAADFLCDTQNVTLTRFLHRHCKTPLAFRREKGKLIVRIDSID